MRRFRLRLVPSDESFFDLFVALAQRVRSGAEAYERMLAEFVDLGARALAVRDLEHEGDDITHEIIRRLNTVFITPIDHEDIHALASKLDDVLDHVEAAADLIVLHKIDAPLPEMKAQADVLHRTASAALRAVEVLPRYRLVLPICLEIDSLENEGDTIYRRAIADLFGGDHKAMNVLKWKDIIDEAEAGIDALEDVANLLEGIALKQG